MGPEDFWEFARFAAICAGVAMVLAPFDGITGVERSGEGTGAAATFCLQPSRRVGENVLGGLDIADPIGNIGCDSGLGGGIFQAPTPL